MGRQKLGLVRDVQKHNLLPPRAPHTEFQSNGWVNTGGRAVGIDSLQTAPQVQVLECGLFGRRL